MKRFWTDVGVEPRENGWQITLDGRPLRTQRGAAQVVPTLALAELLAQEWRAQGEQIDPRGFPLRDLIDFALDEVQAGPDAAIERLLGFARTDTLCYRADPDEPLYRRQLTLWEPLLAACEARHAIRLDRTSGIAYRAQPAASIDTLREGLATLDHFTLAALLTLASLATSLVVALAALEPEADAAALFAASNCEEDWQAELWGWDEEAESARETRLAAFTMATRVVAALRA